MNLIINPKQFIKNNSNGIIIGFAIAVALIVLSYMLFHNPHKSLHSELFAAADKIRSYYRDEPGYWKLYTESAKENNLLSEELLSYKEYDLRVGEGVDGTMALPINQSFDMVLKHLNRSACINLSEMKIPEEQQLGLQKITIINGDNETEFMWGAEENPLPIAKYSTREVCKSAENIIIWTFQ